VNCLVVTIEGLSTSLCGVYGSSLAKTPCLDELAMRGEVLDQCFLDSLDTCSQLDSLWTQRHHLQTELAKSQSAANPSSAVQVSEYDGATLWSLADECEVPACLITDSAAVAEHAEAHGCREAVLIQPPGATQPAEDAEGCSVMALFVTAAEMLSERRGFVWIHSTGLKAAWDAPISLRNSFVDPEDPDPPTDVCVPAFAVLPDTDPDAVVGWGQVAAAQASVIDQGLATLLASTAASGVAWSKVLIGLGGVALGEHGYVGSLIPPSCAAIEHPPALFGEVVSCVAVVAKHELSCEADAMPGRRRPEIFQLPDLGATLRDLGGLDPSRLSAAEAESYTRTWGLSVTGLGLPQTPPDWPVELSIACMVHDNRLWIRCPAWSMQTAYAFPISPEIADSEAQEAIPGEKADAVFMDVEPLPSRLYVKPEDRWEVNDVADRRADIVDLLREHARAVLDALREGRREFQFTLDEELVNLLR
jgi:hypothetical protein